MKKIGQKLSFMTKILLVVGLLISNLSSLSVVFAYEAPEDVTITLNEKVLEVSYNEQLSEEVKAVDVKVYESYTYLSGKTEEKELTDSLTAEELLAATEGTLELDFNSMFVNEGEVVNNYELFDGTYRVKVELVDVTDYSVETDTPAEEIPAEDTVTEEVTLTPVEENSGSAPVETVLAVGTYEKEITHKSGLDVKLFAAEGTEIVKINEQYPVSLANSKVKVIAKILSGGLTPEDVFEYNGATDTAAELIEHGFADEIDFNGHLFGEYELPVEVKVNKVLATVEGEETEAVEEVAVVTEEESNFEEVIYNTSVKVLYESYELNAAYLNAVTVSEGYEGAYEFYSNTKAGKLYMLLSLGEDTEESKVTRTMLDVYNILNASVISNNEEEQIISYSLLKDGVDVLESYVAVTDGTSVEDYLAAIALDDTVQVVLSNEGLTITYDVVVAGDLNNDKVLNEEDVLILIEQAVGESEVTDIDKSDMYQFDGKVNTLDVLYLNQLVKTESWDSSISEEEVALNASLDVKANGEALSEENYLTSGDKFTVDYVLSLTDYEVNGIAGLFKYDESLFELVSVETTNEWIGTDENGKFLYLGEESLTGPVETESPETSETEEVVVAAEENSEVVNSVDYVVVTATFKALKATAEGSNNVITLDKIELSNSTEEGVVYYLLDNNTISSEAIEVFASADNTLSYLEVAGVKIDLEDGVYEYEITVENDITAVDLKYIVNNVAANVTSTVCPEELAEGSNTIVVTVTSENGVAQDYTITVVREEAPEETTQVGYTDNYYGSYDDEDEEVVVTPEPEVEEEVEEESNLSKIIIIILILLVIAGLVYLIFKDENDEETKKANKEINKLKKEVKEPEVEVVTTVKKTADKPNNKQNVKSSTKTNTKTSGKTNNSNKTKKSNNNKKER